MCIFNCQYCNKGQPHRCRNCGMLDSHFTRNCPNKSKVFKKSYFGSSHGIFINRSFKKGHVKEPCILLIKEKYGKYAGKLNMPGGKIEFGFNARSTMEKEADEEFGYSLGNVVRSKSYFRKLYFKIKCSKLFSLHF